MVPQQLTLRYFLSYREVTLDFRGLHVACISGSNGAGKSSLLEAIAWAVWGQSRVASEDDVIHQGALEAQVDFVFEHQQQIYRIIRTRCRGQGGTLEFQVQVPTGFRPLTRRGMKATQHLIHEVLKLDYDTFVNSAYLRQGRADEFMLKRPSERKQILADLLKLGQYDDLTERAKEVVREAKAQISVLVGVLQSLEIQLHQRSAIAQEFQEINAYLDALQQAQIQAAAELAVLQDQQQQRQDLQQALTLQQQRAGHLAQEGAHYRQALATAEQQQQALTALLTQAEVIEAGWQTLQALQAEEERMAVRSRQMQALQGDRDRLHQRYQATEQALQQQHHQMQLQLTTVEAQLQELHPILQKRASVETALAQLQTARAHLRHLDQVQMQVSPLVQRRQTLQGQVDREQAHLSARLEALGQSESQLQQQQAQQPQLQQAVLEVGQTLEQLAARREYQEQVREKGQERRRFMDQLQADQRNYEVQLAQIDQKLQLLAAPDALCPVCDRPLDQPHWEQVLTQHQTERAEIQRQIWVIREQLAVSEREIQVLRQEYRDLEAELSGYGAVLEQRGQLQAQINATISLQGQLQALLAERQHLERCLREETYAPDIREELGQIDAQLATLAYDDRDHALARGKVDALRWAEIKQAEIQQAERKQARLLEQRPLLEAEITDLTQQLQALARSDLAQQIQALTLQIESRDYRPEAHQQVREALKQAQPWAARYHALTQAREQAPKVQQQVLAAQGHWAQIQTQQGEIAAEMARLTTALAALPDPQATITMLEAQGRDRQQQREAALAQAGALQQQLDHFDQLQEQYTAQQQALLQVQRRVRVYQELATAFGRNGLQALLIENALPQLEAETNHTLGRLSANQLHVQFVTQRAGRSRHKLIDTLDILIADAQGTRPYETYSGGEAFRVNFAIRLALAQLLAQRSGTPLQMLIIDEGFGTQDKEGCDRLIGAINAIAADFACVLAVTHVPHFREAFQTRIDVVKTVNGSQVSLSL